MENNLREYAARHIAATRSYRSWHIGKYGILCEVRIPIESSQNVYGDFKPVEILEEYEVPLEFDLDQYNRQLSIDGVSKETLLPLQARARLEDNIPIGALIDVDMYNLFGEFHQIETFIVSKPPEVITTVLVHAKKLSLTPWRGKASWR